MPTSPPPAPSPALPCPAHRAAPACTLTAGRGHRLRVSSRKGLLPLGSDGLSGEVCTRLRCLRSKFTVSECHTPSDPKLQPLADTTLNLPRILGSAPPSLSGWSQRLPWTEVSPVSEGHRAQRQGSKYKSHIPRKPASRKVSCAAPESPPRGLPPPAMQSLARNRHTRRRR